MKQRVTENTFVKAFRDAGRADNFSDAGLRALFHYLEEYEDGTEEEIELDVIALCCDYNEIAIEEVFQETGETLEDLRMQTEIIEVDDETIIYQSY